MAEHCGAALAGTDAAREHALVGRAPRRGGWQGRQPLCSTFARRARTRHTPTFMQTPALLDVGRESKYVPAAHWHCRRYLQNGPPVQAKQEAQ